MALGNISIPKLFRESFSGKNPLQVTLGEQTKLANEIKDRLDGMTYIKVEQTKPYWSSRELPPLTNIVVSGGRTTGRYSYVPSTYFELHVRNGQLIIKNYRDEAVVSSLDELVNFAANCQDRIDRKEAKRNKRERIREFKAQAIIAKIKQLAREERFSFMTGTDTQKLKLFVKLSDKQAVQINIPFSQFQDILPQLQAVVRALRDLEGRGVGIKMVRSTWGTWTTPEALDNEQTEI